MKQLAVTQFPMPILTITALMIFFLRVSFDRVLGLSSIEHRKNQRAIAVSIVAPS
jgi:hypothetical protein